MRIGEDCDGEDSGCDGGSNGGSLTLAACCKRDKGSEFGDVEVELEVGWECYG